MSGGRKGVRQKRCQEPIRGFLVVLAGGALIRDPFDRTTRSIHGSSAERATALDAPAHGLGFRLGLGRVHMIDPIWPFVAMAKRRATPCLQQTREPNGKGCSTAIARPDARDSRVGRFAPRNVRRCKSDRPPG